MVAMRKGRQFIMATKPIHASLTGISGNDVLFGGMRNDLLTGGAGSDTFVIAKGYGSDTVSDFAAGAGGDLLRFQNYGFATFASSDAPADVSGTSTTLESLNTSFNQDLKGDGVIDAPATVIEATGNIRLTLSQMTQAATIDPGATLELAGANSGSITFSGSTGTLILDHSSSFTGKIFNLTGNGNPLSSDQIDLKDIAFGSGTTGSYAGNSSGGILTISDAQNHTAHLSLVGNYTNSTFTLSSDGHGGTTVIDPPATPFALGVYVGNPNNSSPNEEADFEAHFNAFSTLMGAKPQYLDQFGNQNDPISHWVDQATWNAVSVAQSPVLKNVTPVIGLPMSSTAPGSGTADQFYQAFAAGTYDSVLKGMVKAWADNGFTTQIWRPGWEMNVSTMPSYAGDDAATRADWIKAFQHISTVLHAAGQADGVNVQVMWNANVQNYSNAGNVIQTAYPGDQYVDIIGADVYGDVHPYGTLTHLYDWDKSGQVLDSPNPVYDTSLQQWAADPVNLLHYYNNPASTQWSLDGSSGHATTLQQLIDLAKSTGKPLAIAETGAGNADGAGLADNPTFVQWLSQTLQQSGVTVKFVNIWDSNGGGSYEFSKATDGKPLEAAAWAKYFGAAVALNAPTVASFSPDSNVIGDGITNANHLTLAGTAVAGSTVEVFDGTTQIGTTTANGSGARTFATATLSDGNQAFTSKAMDAAGKVSAASAALNVTVDTVAPNVPTVASFSPDSNVIGDGITNVNHLTLSGTAVAGSTVEVFDGATQIGTATANGSGAWSFATATLADGSHAFASKAMDAAGNISAASAVLNVNVDTLAPNAPNVISDKPASANAMIVSGTAEVGSIVKLLEGTTLLGTGTVDSSGSWNINTGPLSPGPHNLSATATDAAGNVSNLSNVLDPVVGTVIEAFGSTSLVEFGKSFYLTTSSTGAGPELNFAGAAIVAGQFGAWTPNGAEQTATGYEVAWKLAGADTYTVWTTSSSGNFIASAAHVSGTSATLESLETSFHQDLNGDGVIGIPATATVIAASGSTSLVRVGIDFYLNNNSSGSGPELKSAGAAVVAGQFGEWTQIGKFGEWTPIGAEQTATGYQVAWKVAGADMYTVWNTDSNGNFVGSTAHVSGTSATLVSLEASFYQDLNGDGVIGTPTTVIEATGNIRLTLSQMTQAATIDAGATLELAGADSGSITFAGSTGTLVLDHSSAFTGKILNLTGNGNPSSSDQIDLKDIAFGSGTTASYVGTSSGGTLTISDAQNHTANLSLVGNYTNSKFSLSSDGNGGTLVIDPPEDNFNFTSAHPAANGPNSPLVSVAGVGNDGFFFHQLAGAGSPDSFAPEGFASKIENSNLTLVNDAQLDHQWLDAGHHVQSINPVAAHFAELHAGDYIIH
jgi:hypothetical protein